MSWKSAERRKISWRDLWAIEASQVKFIIKATYNVFPTAQNLREWVSKDDSFKLCNGIATLRHILSGYKASLTPSCYTGRHSQVPKWLAWLFESVRFKVNPLELQVPHVITSIFLRLDMGLYSEWKLMVYFIELTVLCEDVVEVVFERKKLKYEGTRVACICESYRNRGLGVCG